MTDIESLLLFRLSIWSLLRISTWNEEALLRESKPGLHFPKSPVSHFASSRASRRLVRFFFFDKGFVLLVSPRLSYSLYYFICPRKALIRKDAAQKGTPKVSLLSSSALARSMQLICAGRYPCPEDGVGCEVRRPLSNRHFGPRSRTSSSKSRLEMKQSVLKFSLRLPLKMKVICQDLVLSSREFRNIRPAVVVERC